MKGMSNKRLIENRIKARRTGIPFGIEELYDSPKMGNLTSVILNGLKAEGKVVKLARGVYYKPKQSKYGLGNLPVDEKDMIDFVIRKYNGYPSGVYAYNLAGFTLQTARIIEIATPKPQKRIKIGNYEFVFKKAPYGYAEAKDNADLLIILDALTNPNEVPDQQLEDIQYFIRKKIGEMDNVKADKLVELSLNYPTRTRKRLMPELNSQQQNKISSTLRN